MKLDLALIRSLPKTFRSISPSTKARDAVHKGLPALPAVLALMSGSLEVYSVRHLALDPDVIGFQAIARDMTLGTVFGGMREPLWPLLLVIPVRLLGEQSALVIRFIGVCGFVFMIVAFQLLAGQLFGRAWSIVTASLLAVSPWLVYQSARGLREETSAALILIFCLGLIQPKISGRGIVLLFMLAGITGLLRWDTMVVMLPALALALLLRRPHAAAWIAGPAVLVLLVGPLLVANYVEHGDALYHSNIHARFFRNVEFHDQPGFVTSAEMATNSYVGPPITWTQYVFGLHSPAELMMRVIRSFETIPTRVAELALFTPEPPNGGPLWSYRPRHLPGLVIQFLPDMGQILLVVIWVLGVVGGISLLRSRAWPIALILGGTILLYSPIADLIDYRLVLTVFPLLVLCFMEAGRLGILRLAGLRQRSRTSKLLTVE